MKINSIPEAGFVYDERSGCYESDITHRVTGAHDIAIVIVK